MYARDFRSKICYLHCGPFWIVFAAGGIPIGRIRLARMRMGVYANKALKDIKEIKALEWNATGPLQVSRAALTIRPPSKCGRGWIMIWRVLHWHEWFVCLCLWNGFSIGGFRYMYGQSWDWMPTGLCTSIELRLHKRIVCSDWNGD